MSYDPVRGARGQVRGIERYSVTVAICYGRGHNGVNNPGGGETVDGSISISYGYGV